MSPADYRKAADLFEQLRELQDSERASALDAACLGDTGLRAEVLRLLEGDRAATARSFLERLAIEDAARFVKLDPLKPPAAGFAAKNILLGPLLPGAQLGPYEIVDLLGAGGMGEVYRARDSQLNRDVAIKVLPAALSKDAQHMARFAQEAKVLASLNHPNIATVYGIEQGALVMELVEGDNLRGPLPIEDAIPVARQIAIGLEAAHERGIVHRDLKPANIKISPSGVVKLLDFGLAQPAPPAAAGHVAASPVSSPPPSPVITLEGMILGTAAYMSPEQARGKPVDKRTDIWAFGVVLYEMLAGQRPFGGDSITATLNSVVRDEPDLGKLPSETPVHILRLIARCLRKDVNLRLRDIGEARVLLDEPAEVLPPVPPGRKWLLLAAAVFAIAAVTPAALWLRRPPEEPRTLRLSVLPPEKTGFSAISMPAVSPDGRRVAFAAGGEGKTRLWIRDLNGLAASPIPDSDGAFDPFWAPDSRSLAFFVPGKLKTVAIGGGPPVVVCDAPDGRGGSWNRNGVIAFAPTYGGPLFRVAADGGSATPLTTLEQRESETSHRFPWFLPDGRHFLFTVRSANPENTGVYLGDLESKDRRLLVAAASNAAYAPPGYLLFMRQTTLMEQAFNIGDMRPAGSAIPIADHVDYVQGSAQGQFSVSQTGLLAYFSGGGSLKSQLTWFNRSGQQLGTIGQPAVMQAAAISPNGETVVVDRLDSALGTYDLWLFDTANGTDSRFTFDPANDSFPVWSPDGSRILFSSDRTGTFGLYQRPATGAGREELVFEGRGVTVPTDWPDPRFAIFSNTAAKTRDDVWVLSMTGDRKAFPFLQSVSSESHGRLAPGGHWLAYDSDETGDSNVYVQTFPEGGGKWQLSDEGGSRPVWGRDGRELFYISRDDKLMSVEVNTKGRFEHGVPKALFEVRVPPTGPFDIARDGRRFLILNGVEPEGNSPMTLVVNWSAGLKR